MGDKKKTDADELKAAYEADKERRNVREDELQAAKDYLGVLLDEIETKNKELEDKKKEAEELTVALKKAEVEKLEETDAKNEARESERFKSVWIAIAIIEFIAIIALAVVVLNNHRQRNDTGLQPTPEANGKDDPSAIVTDVPDGEEETVPVRAELGKLLAEYLYKKRESSFGNGQTGSDGKEGSESVESITELLEKEGVAVENGFTCRIEKIDGLEYLVFFNDEGFKVCYKNEYYKEEKDFKKAVIIEKGDKRLYEHIDYDLSQDISVLCPKICRMNNTEMVMISDYSGFGSMPEYLRIYYYDGKVMKEYNGDDLFYQINKLMNLEFPDKTTGINDYPILLELTTSRINSVTGKKILYKYGLTEASFSEIGYSDSALDTAVVADIKSDFRIELLENGMAFKTVVRLGRKVCLGELKADLILSASSVVLDNASFGAYVPANLEDPEFNGVIIPAESIPERYLTIIGNNSERYYIPLNDNIKECSYDWERLDHDDPNNWVYLDENGEKISIRGIDVSKYQDEIDWAKVAKAGIEFAIIRLGYRGMNEGTLELDPYFEANIKGALESGIKVGVYFFSQAITKEEAVEEAEFVIEALKEYEVTYPVVFDTERVTSFKARANELGFTQRTDMCIAFCDRIKEAGYSPMVYANTKYMIMGIDLERLGDYGKWFACYRSDITFPYDFQILQYSESGTVPGVKGNVDLDISFIDYSKADEKNG